jgi:hypothetical protein
VIGKRRACLATGSLLPITAYLLSITACHSSPEKEQETLRRELRSWEATARLVDELSEGGALPRVYLRQISEAIAQGKQKVAQQTAKSAQ